MNLTKLDKRKRIVISYSIGVFLFLVVTVLCLVVIILSKQKLDETSTQGLYPSIGLGRYFADNRFDYYVDKLYIELHDVNNADIMGDQVREMILDNYTLLGDTYYYNEYIPYLQYVVLIKQFLIYVIIAGIFLIISIFALLFFILKIYKNEECSKGSYIIVTLLSFLSLDMYAFYKLMKIRRENI